MTYEPDSAPEIRIDAVDPATMDLWRTVARVARVLDDEHMRWMLVGGLMVALFAIEAGQSARPTVDIDVLGDARQRPSATEWMTERLRAELGAVPAERSGFEAERGFRFEVGGQIVDVLAPDGLGGAATTEGSAETIQIPGGTQALGRSETVVLVVDDERVALRRPSLLGAILLKARSLAVHSRPEDQRLDLILLLGLMNDPRAAAADLEGGERGWLRDAEYRLRLDDPELDATVDPVILRVARAALQILIATDDTTSGRP